LKAAQQSFINGKMKNEEVYRFRLKGGIFFELNKKETFTLINKGMISLFT
jgi:hypothetical protein